MSSFLSILTAAMLALSPAEQGPRFAGQPRVVADQGQTRIEFAVAAPTDATVVIEDAAGRIVRHLAAGCLGPNAPAPFKPGELSQTIVWDGKADSGQPAAGGPFKVRVALGLSGRFDRFLFDEPQLLLGVNGLAADSHGRLYVKGRANDGGMGVGTDIRLYNAAGKYLRTIAPFPAGLDETRAAGLGVIMTGPGQYVPRIGDLKYYSFHPVDPFGPRYTQMAVGKDGRVFFLADGYICVLDDQGGVPAGLSFAGKGFNPFDKSKPAGPSNLSLTSAGYLAASSDGKRLYLSAAMGKSGKKPLPAVFWTDAAERGPVQVLCGDPGGEGGGAGQLKEPAGAATDGKGRLLVADRGNDRIAVFNESDGRFVAAIPLAGVDKVQVDPASGAVYALTFVKDKSDLVKFSADYKELCRLALPPGGAGQAPFLAVCGGPKVERPVAWVGSNGYRPYTLLRIADEGDKFGQPVENSPRPGPLIEDVFVDRARNEVHACLGDYYWRFADGQDQAERVPIKVGGNAGTQLQVASNGDIYGYSWGDRLHRWDRTGKPLPFEQTGKNELKIPSTMTYQMRGLFIDQRTDELYLLQPPAPRPSSTKPPHVLRVYDLAGNLKREVLARIGESAVGPRTDRHGNIYVGESARPGSPALPEFFDGKVPPIEKEAGKSAWLVKPETFPYSWGYGCVVKFSPAGGEIAWACSKELEANYKPWAGTPPRDAVAADFFRQSSAIRIDQASSKGVLWARGGFFPLTATVGCNCLASYFDVDDLARVFHPDAARSRVSMLDANGNVIGHFGRYGNRDAAGKDEDIPLAMPLAVAATDRFAYIADIVNQRVVRVRLTYQAEEVLPIP